jgi:hypothetical protein
MAVERRQIVLQNLYRLYQYRNRTTLSKELLRGTNIDTLVLLQRMGSMRFHSWLPIFMIQPEILDTTIQKERTQIPIHLL